MDWVFWVLFFLAANLPIATLLPDPTFDLPAPRLIRFTWRPAPLVLAVAIPWAVASRQLLLDLLLCGEPWERAQALPDTLTEAGVSRTLALLVGYGWHALNSLGFGVAYILLFGHGTTVLALARALFIWVGMVVMPVMMPTIRFPMPSFLVVPFVAHVAMAGPIGYFAFSVSEAVHRASLLGRLLP